MEIKIHPKKIAIFLSIIVILLITFHTVTQIYFAHSSNKQLVKTAQLFNLDGENNLPSFYSSVALLFSSILLFLIAYASKKNGEPYLHWAGLAVIFLFLCCDEWMEFHEKIMNDVRDLLHTSGIFYYAWVIPYGIFLIFLAIIYFKFLLSLPKQTSKLFIISGFIYVLGAMGFELLAGLQFEIDKTTDSAGFVVLAAIEETFEMFGIVIFIYALTSYIKIKFPQLTIKFN